MAGKLGLGHLETLLEGLNSRTVDFTDTTIANLAAVDIAGTLTVDGATTQTGKVSTPALGGFTAGMASISGLTPVVLTTSTLAVATHSVQKGKYVQVAADAQTLTLPAVVVGASFIIVNTAADGGALLTISPNANDKFLVDIAGAAGTDDKDIVNTKATQIQYDYVKLVGLSADGWLIDDIRGIWVDQS